MRLIPLALFLCMATHGQSPETIMVRDYRIKNEQNIMQEFVSLLSIPNVASDSVNIGKNAAFIMEMMKRRGIGDVKLLSSGVEGTAPAIYGEVKVPGAKNTLVFYAHYDGQPVNPAQWAAGLYPFVPALFTSDISHGQSIAFPAAGSYDPKWRIYARGASDDKAGVTAILNAYEALVKTGRPLRNNIKFFFEGEEEAGSTHLPDILQKYVTLLQSDLWILCDGPVHQSGKKLVALGVRGDAHLDLTVYGPKRPLHSGHYGNWAPNPAMMLAKLLASMKDEQGRVSIKGFYDDVKPLTTAELKALRSVPRVDEQMKDELGLVETEMKGSLVELISLPSLNINGMQSANVGRLANNIIPTTATAVLDLRLVPGNDWQRQQQKVIAHIQRQGYTVLDRDPTDAERKKYPQLIRVLKGEDGYNAQRTSIDLPLVQKVIQAVQSTTPEKIVLLPTLGGSLPLFIFEKYLGAKTLTVPIANHDNNQHAENENIRLLNLWNGIETMAALMQLK